LLKKDNSSLTKEAACHEIPRVMSFVEVRHGAIYSGSSPLLKPSFILNKTEGWKDNLKPAACWHSLFIIQPLTKDKGSNTMA